MFECLNYRIREIMARLSAALCLLPLAYCAYPSVSITSFGAVGDNATDNTAAIHAALAAVQGGGEVIVPAGIFKTGPFNLTSSVCLTVLGTVWGLENASAFPRVQTPPSYLSSFPAWRHHPFVWAPNATNVTIRGSGTLNGGGPYWWSGPERTQDTRPHLLELHNVTGAEVSGITLHNSAFWTFRPIYCKNVWIHDMKIEELYGAGDNTDGKWKRKRERGRERLAYGSSVQWRALLPTLSLTFPPLPPPTLRTHRH